MGLKYVNFMLTIEQSSSQTAADTAADDRNAFEAFLVKWNQCLTLTLSIQLKIVVVPACAMSKQIAARINVKS